MKLTCDECQKELKRFAWRNGCQIELYCSKKCLLSAMVIEKHPLEYFKGDNAMMFWQKQKQEGLA